MPGHNDQALAGGGGTVVPFGGRISLFNTLRWMTATDQYGLHTDVITHSANQGADPDIQWDAWGIGVNTGDVVSEVILMGRTNNVEVDGVEFRMYLIQGPLDGTWIDIATTTATLLGTVTGAFGGTGYRRHEMPINHTVTAPGFLVPYLKPEGTLVNNRYLHLDGLVKFGGS